MAPSSFLCKLGLSRKDESSSDSEIEVNNVFTAPSENDTPTNTDVNKHTPSVFSQHTRSSMTRSSRNTEFTGDTADTGNSLRSDVSKRQRLPSVDVETGRIEQSRKSPRNFDELLHALQALITKMESLDRQTTIDNAPRVSATLARLINDYTSSFGGMKFDFDNEQIPDELLSTILRIVLGFSDVYLVEQAHRSASAHLLRALFHFARSLRLLDYDSALSGFLNPSQMDNSAVTVPHPQIFALGSRHKTMPNEHILEAVLTQFASGSVPIAEQEGAYAAPVLRGFSPRFSVATLCLGIPDLKHHHIESIVALRSELKTLHVFCRRDSIIPASTSAQPRSEIKPPYRIPVDPLAPPMSISLAAANSTFVSGTLGGFVYPQVPNSKDRNTYALSCGHVCLQEESDGDVSGDANPKIMYPSPVLRNLFRKALQYQSERFPEDSSQKKVIESGIAKVDREINNELGEVVWGERAVIGHQMSDIAVIKCHPRIKCQNYLGDDVDYSQYDPSLLLEQLRVRTIIGKSRGLQIFKYGSTSRYTSGVVSTIRVAYWASGKMQTSEFAVRSGESSSFANGGDSGAWILSSTNNGLGVVGMLHSYDGEFREFGLYTPISHTLSRLHEVTGVPWGVLGVPSGNDYLYDEGEKSE